MKIYLVRHGESEGNKQRLLYGWSDLPLTEAGREQAREVGKKLRGESIARCCASPLSRAAETARLCMEGSGLEIEYMDDLREQSMGELENVPFERMVKERPEILTLASGWTSVVPPGGESYSEMSARAVSRLDEILEAGEDAVIVAHNGPLGAILVKLLELDGHAADKMLFQQGCYSCVEIIPYMARLVCFNK